MSLRVGLLLGPHPNEPLELALLRAGHRIEWRAQTADEAIGLIADRAPDVLLIADQPTLTRADVVGAADLIAVRSVLVHSGAPSAHGMRLGLADQIAVVGENPPDVSSLMDEPAAPRVESLPAPAPTTAPTPPAAPTPPTESDATPVAGGADGRRAARAEEDGLVAPTRIPFHPIEGAGEAPVPSRIIAVWGPTGAPGRTLTATSLAAELAVRGRRVVLVDADTYGGTIAPALGLLDESPGFAAACRLAGSGALSDIELDRVSQPLPRDAGIAADRLRVLTGIGRPSRWPELSNDRVTAALEACRSWSDVVVVDVGFNLETDEELSSDLFAPRRNAATIAALRAADRIVAVGAGDPLGLARLLRTYPDLLETVADTPVQVVVTRVRSSVLGIDPGTQVRHTLDRFAGIRDAVLIDDDPAAADAALLSARPVPVIAPKSALRQSVAELADRLGYAMPRLGRQRSPFLWRRTG
ncbi:MinD-like ATPase involved in chromosome partitioning or flagellar assembly [Microcella putealis]|uniref:MinD-like ATPase involved in chromosome partitioning or flagellar assembly n=1 Tax=Microcella putealis TaxID=337005 RepID=A0A4Q7LUJ3_9MICO|nr:tyrosine-protein kinase family protein [Microcella putealis]RZS57449.1 MinD-like ATPase involved in chromosome partitioning or flagellar assembly [Microcella putealis]TQM24516.1 MinD-like ATPase involved in chromosome partitioning or flagellar assembly [Microcella putealis]